MTWRELNSTAQFTQLIEESQQHPVAIFKHSTRCSVSFMVKRMLDASWDIDPATLPTYFLDLIQHRDVSNAIAVETGIRHESPQLIVIDKGQAVYAASHHGIDVDGVKETVLG